MKVRNGFISNSSSSSFLVGFKSIPTTRKELKELMFPGMKDDDHVTFYDNVIHVKDCITTVFNDIQSNKHFVKEENFTKEDINHHFEDNNYREIDNEIRTKNYTLWAEYQDVHKIVDAERKSKVLHEYWNLQDKISNKLSLKDFKSFIKENKDLEFVEFSYADEDGSYFSVMEHGDIFRNLIHKRTSHH